MEKAGKRRGTYSGKLNSERDKPGYFNAPIGITVERSGTIIVVDYGNDRVQGLLRNGTVKFVTGNEPGDPFEFKGPYSATVDPLNGDILVTNRGANEIAVLDKDGKKLTAFGSSILNYPHELEFGPKHALYVADLYHHRLAIFHDRSDKNVSYINFPASWGYPKTVSVDKEGRIAVGFAGSTEAFVAVIATDPSLALPSEVPPPNSRVMSMMASIGFGTPRPKTRTTEELYSRYCSNCHETGNFGAPKRRSDDWDKFSHDIGTLLPLARSGIGAMIPSGGCADCSDQELKDLIAFMLPDWKSN